MNVELLKKVRDAIEMEPEMYTQSRWGISDYLRSQDTIFLDCKTPGCIAGHAIVHGDPTKARALMGEDTYVGKIAQKLLGLTQTEREFLFDARWPFSWIEGDGEVPLRGNRMHIPSSEEAVQLLNRLIEYGFEEE